MIMMADSSTMSDTHSYTQSILTLRLVTVGSVLCDSCWLRLSLWSCLITMVTIFVVISEYVCNLPPMMEDRSRYVTVVCVWVCVKWMAKNYTYTYTSTSSTDSLSFSSLSLLMFRGSQERKKHTSNDNSISDEFALSTYHVIMFFWLVPFSSCFTSSSIFVAS